MLHNRVAVVTGASRGIGKAICFDLAKNGAKVAINYHTNKENAYRIQEEILSLGGEAFAIQADVTKENDTKRLIDDVAKQWSGVDILVNCAGAMKNNYLEEMSLRAWREAIDVNLSGVYLASKAAIQFLKQSSYGRIINISSQAAFRGSIAHSHYTAAKAGILGFTYSIARELSAYNITANVISPGRVMTDMMEGYKDKKMEQCIEETPLKRFGKPEEIAYMVSFLASDKAGYITGANIHINGGLYMG